MFFRALKYLRLEIVSHWWLNRVLVYVLHPVVSAAWIGHQCLSLFGHHFWLVYFLIRVGTIKWVVLPFSVGKNCAKLSMRLYKTCLFCPIVFVICSVLSWAQALLFSKKYIWLTKKFPKIWVAVLLEEFGDVLMYLYWFLIVLWGTVASITIDGKIVSA